MSKSRAEYMRKWRANKKQSEESNALVKSIIASMINNAVVVA